MAFFLAPNNCPICKEQSNFSFVRDFKGENEHSLYQCKKCFVQFWEPRKNPGNEWYQSRNPHNFISFEGFKIYRGYHKQFLKKNKNVARLKILDLGCGPGEFIAELKKLGAEVWGVDFDKGAIEIAKNKFGLKNVFDNSFEEFFNKNDLPKFDIITFFEALEHQEDPMLFIEKLKSFLKPGGKIVFSIPSRERVLANSNKWDFPPHHFTRWNKQSIKNIFLKQGFKFFDLNYVEELRIIMASLGNIFKTGLVQKMLKAGKDGNKKIFLSKILYFLGKIKQWILVGIPAIILWIFGKLTKKNNGIIYAEFIYLGQ